jgi:hypothetical protein
MSSFDDDWLTWSGLDYPDALSGCCRSSAISLTGPLSTSLQCHLLQQNQPIRSFDSTPTVLRTVGYMLHPPGIHLPKSIEYLIFGDGHHASTHTSRVLPFSSSGPVYPGAHLSRSSIWQLTSRLHSCRARSDTLDWSKSWRRGHG